MRKAAGRCWQLLKDEGGQVIIEYAMLMILSTVVGFVILLALGQVVNGLYSKLEGEVSRPSHF